MYFRCTYTWNSRRMEKTKGIFKLNDLTTSTKMLLILNQESGFEIFGLNTTFISSRHSSSYFPIEIQYQWSPLCVSASASSISELGKSVRNRLHKRWQCSGFLENQTEAHSSVDHQMLILCDERNRTKMDLMFQ